MSIRHPTPLVLILVGLVTAVLGCGASRPGTVYQDPPGPERAFARQEPFVGRPFLPSSGGRWIGNAVAYGPHRDGQRPGGPSPSREELRQDLGLMLNHWHLLRVYQAAGPSEELLRLIEDGGLDMRVMLGIWITPEERRDADGRILEELPGARAANRREIEAGLRLAATYPRIVVALCVGNETQVSWSDHRVPPELLIRYVREARERGAAPVTTADDFNFWNKPESDAVAREVDFIAMNAHPLWNGRQLEEAVEWTRGVYADVRARHPDRTLVLGETGWATSKHDEGEQATLIKGRPGEAEQKRFYEALTAWIEQERIPTFVFEAFDENWKGGPAADEVEKHWGLYRSDRTPKPVLAGSR